MRRVIIFFSQFADVNDKLADDPEAEKADDDPEHHITYRFYHVRLYGRSIGGGCIVILFTEPSKNNACEGKKTASNSYLFI